MYFIGILLLLIGGFISLFCNENLKLKIISIFSCLSTIIILSSLNSFTALSVQFQPFGQIVFDLDELSKFFVTVISFISSLVSIYAIGYVKPYLNKNKKIASHSLFLPLLTAAMLMVVSVQNIFAFLVVWEIMSLASFFLVIFEDDKKEVLSAGIKYLIYMHISVIFIIAAFVIMANQASSYDFDDIYYMFKNNQHLKDIVFLLAFAGFGTKAGFFPMHNWLPYAHPAAPSHVSAIMSAVMIKTGIYGILRVLQLIDKPSMFVSYTVLFVSLITALYGIIYAINQKDIKKLLAYSSVENIGIIGLAIATFMFGLVYNQPFIATLGSLGCFLHILNHSIFKSLLFMGAGSVYLKTHTKNMEQLGGLIKKMPFTAVFFLFAAVAICAFPPLNGFVSEFIIYSGLFYLLNVGSSTLFIPTILTIASLALIGTLVILAMSKVYSITFLGLARSEHSENIQNDVEKSMLIPMGILSALTLIIGIGSPFVINILPIIDFNNSKSLYYIESLSMELQTVILILIAISVISILFLALIVTLFLLRKFLAKKSTTHTTWGCGYDKGNNHIQYTASSFVSPFSSILTPLLKKIFDVKKPKDLFPKDAHYSSKVEDVEEAYIINPVLRFDEKFLSKFERLQDGNIQHYILYGLIFLILVLVGVVFFG